MISVIMPVYNSEKYLANAIDSVLAQSYDDFEIILIDDGSTDSSAQIMNSYCEKDRRISVITQENAGPSRARNAGIDKSHGEWIYFMDSDDTLERTMFQELLMDAAPYDMICSGVIKHHIEEQDSRTVLFPLPVRTQNTEEYKSYLKLLAEDKNQDVIFHYLWNKLIRARIVKENAIRFREDIRLGEDFLFLCEVMKNITKLKAVEKAFYHYYIRGSSSLTGKFDAHELDRRRIVYSALTAVYDHFGLLADCSDALQKREGRLSYLSMRKILYSSCSLSKAEKEAYVRGFLKDERKTFMLRYFSGQKGLLCVLRRMAVLSGNTKLMCSYLYKYG